jgi:serine/threonine protein kinase/formylglycine-generating enzyme required for sulfatase activity
MESTPINAQALPAGTRLEEFVIEGILGSGGFGVTYLARDTSLGRQVVIKENLPAQFCFRDPSSLTVAPRHTTGEDAENFRWSLENFSKEAAMLASLNHPGIVKVLRSFQGFGTAYFVMPFVEGMTLDALLVSRWAKGQCLTEKELHRLLELVLSALGYLHDRGIYHRDIKPGNILITNEGVPLLIDFGSARQRLSERSMTVVESAGYTPFEQLQSRGNVGPWSDLYALGGTLVKALTGEAPPKAMDRMRKDPHRPLAERVDLLSQFTWGFLHGIDKSLAVDEESRWQNAGEWLVLLQREVRAEMPSSEPPAKTEPPPLPKTPRRKDPPSPPEPPPRFEIPPLPAKSPGKTSHPLLWIIAACVVLGLVVGALIGSNEKVDGVDAQQEQAAEQQRLTEAATARATEAEARAARTEQDHQALVAQAKAKDAETTEAQGIKVNNATKNQPFVNSLGMEFVPAGTPGVLFCVWETRLKDFRAFVDDTGYDAINNGPNGMPSFTLEKEGEGMNWKQVGGSWKNPRFPSGHGQNELHPVVCVSYHDAKAFCVWLTKREAGQLPAEWRYRLPTDEEWSAACGPGEFPWGDNYPPSSSDGNYSGTEAMSKRDFDGFSSAGRSDGFARTAPVGSFTQNRYGLFDLGGNVWEWCGTWYQSSMNTAETLEAVPTLKNDDGGQFLVVVRGGSWRTDGRLFVRSASRVGDNPIYRLGRNGFRSVLAGDGG